MQPAEEKWVTLKWITADMKIKETFVTKTEASKIEKELKKENLVCWTEGVKSLSYS